MILPTYDIEKKSDKNRFSQTMPTEGSIQSIASRHSLPIIIRSALGFRGSNQSILLYSIEKITFAYGRVLRKHQVKNSVYQSFRPIDSELIAIPLNYPGYFECIEPGNRGPDDGIQSSKNVASIVEQMENDYRPQTFYIDSSLRVYTLEINSKGEQNRVWEEIAPHQLLTIEELTFVEYIPTENDQLTPDDFGYYWWFCFLKYILKRREYAMKCVLSNKKICYIPCSSTDEIRLYPVGQPGSTNVKKLQTIENLLKNFSLPIHIKLLPFPGISDTYTDFSDHIQILGSYTKEFAVCASLSSTNVSLMSLKTPLKFVTTSIPLTSTEIENQLSRCQIFIQSFERQIRRIILLNQERTQHRSRSKHQSPNNNSAKRSSSILSNRSSRPEFRRALSNDHQSTYNSLVHPIQRKSSTPKKHHHSSHFSTPFTYDTGSNLTEELNSPNADGSILFDDKTEIFSFLNR